jgi:hypothetical protein
VGMSKGGKQNVILHTSPQNMLVLKTFKPNQIESAYASVFKNFKAFHFTALKIVMTTC